MPDQVFDDGELIDESGFQKLANWVSWARDRIPKIVFKNNKGNETKRINSMNGKRLQVVGGVVEINDRKSNDEEISINVQFAEPFSGKHPAVVAMAQSPRAYGVSVSAVDNQGFVLQVRKFSASNEFFLNSIHYIAVGQP